MKKTVITIVITAVVAVTLTLLGVKIYNNYNDKQYKKLVEKDGIIDVKEVDYSLPKFNLTLTGKYYSSISNVDINELKTYEVTAVMDDGIYRDVYTYIGVKLTDVFELYGIDDYTNVTFKSNGKLQVTYAKDEIDEYMYLVFKKDGIDYPSDEPVNLLTPYFNSRYSITNIVNMTFE